MNMLSSLGMPALVAGLLITISFVLLIWLVMQRTSAMPNSGKQRSFRLEDWRPRTMRPLTPTELHTCKHLTKALPECLLMPQVALARFLNVSESRSYHQWFSAVGRRCVDFLVCSETGDVLGVIQLLPSKGKQVNEGTQRKLKALEMAQIPVWLIAKDDLPDAQALRAMVMPELKAATAHSQQQLGAEESVWQATKQEPRRPAAFNPMATHGEPAKAKLSPMSERWDQDWPTEDARSSDFLDEFGMIEVPPLIIKGSGRTATGFTR